MCIGNKPAVKDSYKNVFLLDGQRAVFKVHNSRFFTGHVSANWAV